VVAHGVSGNQTDNDERLEVTRSAGEPQLITGDTTVKKLLLTASMLMAISSANAAEIKLLDDSTMGTTLYIGGKIEVGDYERFKALTDRVDKGQLITVGLQSDGGFVDSALDIAYRIHSRGYATMTVSKCYSMCAIIWLAGIPRIATPDAKIGFHGAYTKQKNGTTQSSSDGNALIGAYLARIGMSDYAIEYLTSASPDSLNGLTVDVAKRLGIQVMTLDALPSVTTTPAATSTIAGWWGFIPAILMGMFTVGFIVRTSRA